MKERMLLVRSLAVAIVALAVSASLTFGATPEAASWGLANAASHAGKTVPVAGGEALLAGDDEESTDEDVEAAEDTEETEAGEAGDNCATDPSLLTEEELAELNHGSVVCWAAHQTEWPEWFANHGAFVRCWAHHGKADAASCTEDPNAVEPTTEEPSVDEPTADATVAGHGHGKGKAKGKSNRD